MMRIYVIPILALWHPLRGAGFLVLNWNDLFLYVGFLSTAAFFSSCLNIWWDFSCNNFILLANQLYMILCSFSLNCCSSSSSFYNFDQTFLETASVCWLRKQSIFYVVCQISYHMDYSWLQKLLVPLTLIINNPTWFGRCQNRVVTCWEILLLLGCILLWNW